MIHDPHHVAHLAAVLLSSRTEHEAHHIKAAVEGARGLLDEAHRRADEDVALRESAKEAPASDGDVPGTGGEGQQ